MALQKHAEDGVAAGFVDEAALVAELRAEIATLKDDHALEIRRLEIASYKAELELSQKLKYALAIPQETRGAHAPSPTRRNFLFRQDGQPTKLLLRLLFSRSGRVRKLTRRIVLKKNGRPRDHFMQWMTSRKYQNLPNAFRFRENNKN